MTLGLILRRYRQEFLRRYPRTAPGVARTLRVLAACRTATLGGHVSRCTHCGVVTYHYHSCGNRHCPQCGGQKRAAWLEQRRAELLPVPYFHVVFTLPHTLSALLLGNRRLLYGLLFDAAAQTLREVAANPKHLGARIGVLAVLHTWGQQLEHHPHVHCVVPGGGLSGDASGSAGVSPRWGCRPTFFVPVKVLSRVFRGKYLAGLRQAQARGELHFAGSTAPWAEPTAWAEFVGSLYRTPWVVYAKEPFGGPEQVLKYLTRYTHRVALSNSRLVRWADDQVTLTWKDYANGCQRREMTLAAVEFIRRFSMHILPRGLVRIRQYGLLAHRDRQERLARCRALLAEASPAPEPSVPAAAAPAADPVTPVATHPWLGPCLLAGLLLLTGTEVAASLLAAGLSAVASLVVGPETCSACGVGRLETIWRGARPTGAELDRIEIPDTS